MKAVLITGCSSGLGLETARCFLERGWNIIATMRTPRQDILPPSGPLRVLTLDITRPDSMAALLDAVAPIDVLVNNAGIGLRGVSRPRRWPRRGRSSRPTPSVPWR
jgi:NAD(P)-dependent dehydrogenase (short-subunit alcohol dehydrogenase family)